MKKGRNEPCYCGSGRKYKKCCGSPASTSKIASAIPSNSTVHVQASLEVQKGNQYLGNRKVEEALVCFRKALMLKPEYPEALVGIGTIQFMLRKYNDAFELYKQAVKQNPELATVLYDYGNSLQEQNLLDEAVEVYKETRIYLPGDSNVLTNMGAALVKAERFNEAITVLQKAIELNPDDVLAYKNWAGALISQGELAEAEKILLKGLATEKDYLGICNILAMLYERLNQLDKSYFYAEEVLKRDPSNPNIILIMAAILRRRNKPEEGLAVLSKIVISQCNKDLAMSIHYELGRLNDQLHKSREAIHQFQLANGLWTENSSFGTNSYCQKVEKKHLDFKRNAGEFIASIDSDKSTQGEQPVFMVGFPRSGTTLLDQILDSHPDLQVLEEKPILTDALSQITSLAGTPSKILLKISDVKLKLIQELYWQLAKESGLLPGVKLVDKLPLNIVDCDLIARLFSGARIIVSLRHPCDVCLSSFMQDFQPNEAMAGMTSLDDTVKLYTVVMDLWLEYEKVLPLSFHRFHYEGLVEDFEKEMNSLVRFLGIEWSDTFQKYHLYAARKDIINTPSYSQVVEPIYTAAKYRWLRYRDYFEPYLPILRPYIREFGYSEE